MEDVDSKTRAYINKRTLCEVHRKMMKQDECLMANGCKCPWYGLCWSHM